jgi:hypothetical protein
MGISGDGGVFILEKTDQSELAAGEPEPSQSLREHHSGQPIRMQYVIKIHIYRYVIDMQRIPVDHLS